MPTRVVRASVQIPGNDTLSRNVWPNNNAATLLAAGFCLFACSASLPAPSRALPTWCCHTRDQPNQGLRMKTLSLNKPTLNIITNTPHYHNQPASFSIRTNTPHYLSQQTPDCCHKLLMSNNPPLCGLSFELRCCVLSLFCGLGGRAAG